LADFQASALKGLSIKGLPRFLHILLSQLDESKSAEPSFAPIQNKMDIFHWRNGFKVFPQFLFPRTVRDISDNEGEAHIYAFKS